MKRIGRTLTVLLLAFALSLSAAFAAEETTKSTEPAANSASQTKPAQPKTGVVKIKDHYYYKDSNKRIRKKAGFIKWKGDKYYIQEGGKIITTKTFEVGRHKYRARKNGKIAVGVYRWGKAGKLYFSDKKGRWVRIKSHRCQKGVKWEGKWYYLQTDSEVAVNRPVVIKDQPYYADSEGVCRKLKLKKTNNAVLKKARKQIGKYKESQVEKFWTWYYGTRFVDTDRTPWCGSFVAWCYREAGQYDRIRKAKNYGPLGYVPAYSRFARYRGKWIPRRKARGGDIIVFGNDRHVGIVDYVYKGYIYTVEGNSGPDAEIGTGKPGAVTRRVYSLKDPDIKGVLRP